jgi:catechol 2,3-dioxygenase-like lactoylglutathione lyase family enzyme
MLTKSATFTMLQVKDPERARHFYVDQLGLHEQSTLADGTTYLDAGSDSGIGLRPMPDSKPSGLTELSFEVSNIESEIADLERRGVRFEDYDLPDLTTVDHVAVMGAEKAAWFKDPDGNVLCLHQAPNGRNN